MARQTIVLFSCFAAVLLAVSPLLAQNKNQASAPRPDLQPGDKLEVLDMGRLREAEFVEFTPVGLIKVRFEDDSQLAFRPTHVRLAKGAQPREPKLTAKLPEKLVAKLPAAKEAARAAAAAAAPPVDELKINRKWQDVSGQFSIEAEFVTLQEGKVELKKPDGKVISVPLDKLAAADQEIARKLATAANPFEQNVTEFKPPPLKLTTLSISLSEARKIHPIPDAPWSMQPDPAPPAKEFPTAPIFIPSEEGFHCYNSPHMDLGNGWVWFFVRSLAGKEMGRIERIDLQSRKQLARMPVPFKTRILDVSPSGKWVAVMQHELTSQPAEFQLWQVDGQTVQPAKSLTPFTAELVRTFGRIEGDSHNVVSAEFVDDRHLFVVGHGPGVMLDLQTGKGIYIIRNGAFFSPNRRYLAACITKDVSLEKELVVLESLTGNCVGKLDLEGGGEPASLAFNSAGTRLAGVNARNVWVWDLQNGQVETSWHDVEVPVGVSSQVHLTFGTHDQLLINGDSCFSLTDGFVSSKILWPNDGTHNFVRFLEDVQGRSWFYISRSDRRLEQYALGMASYQLPGPAIHKAYTESDLSNLLVIKPGSRFGLKFLGLPPEMIADFRTSLAAEFTKKGWSLAAEGEAGDFEVVYSLENAPAEERIYYRHRDTVNQVKTTVHPQLAKVQLRKAGQESVLWQRSTRFNPRSNGYLPEGVSVEEASLLIRDWKFFEETRIPARLIQYPKNRDSVVRVNVDSTGKLVVDER